MADDCIISAAVIVAAAGAVKGSHLRGPEEAAGSKRSYSRSNGQAVRWTAKMMLYKAPGFSPGLLSSTGWALSLELLKSPTLGVLALTERFSKLCVV
jgi:hypothetical protein